ncbi:hypothetical protein ACIP68_05025 [Streptomyces griseoviridis]
MTEQPHEVPETFTFVCGSCGQSWEATFRLLFFTDPLAPTGGATQEYVDEAGRSVRSPLTDAVCPRCGGRRVRVLETDRAEREARAEQAHQEDRPHRENRAHREDPEHPPHRPHLPPHPHLPHHPQHPHHPHLPHRSRPDDGASPP